MAPPGECLGSLTAIHSNLYVHSGEDKSYRFLLYPYHTLEDLAIFLTFPFFLSPGKTAEALCMADEDGDGKAEFCFLPYLRRATSSCSSSNTLIAPVPQTSNRSPSASDFSDCAPLSPSSLSSSCSSCSLEVAQERNGCLGDGGCVRLGPPEDLGPEKRKFSGKQVKPEYTKDRSESVSAAEVPCCLPPPHVLRVFARVWDAEEQSGDEQRSAHGDCSLGRLQKSTTDGNGLRKDSSVLSQKDTEWTPRRRGNDEAVRIGQQAGWAMRTLQGSWDYDYNARGDGKEEHRIHPAPEENNPQAVSAGGGAVEEEVDAGCSAIPDDEEKGIDVLPRAASDSLKQPSYSPFSSVSSASFGSSSTSCSLLGLSSIEDATNTMCISPLVSAYGQDVMTVFRAPSAGGDAPVKPSSTAPSCAPTCSASSPSPSRCLRPSTASFISCSASSPVPLASSSSCSLLTTSFDRM